MKTGDLRHRITIQENQTVKDAEGITEDNWVDTATVWAAIKPLHGRELLAAQAVQSETTGRIEMRYRPGIKPSQRAVFGGRIFEILAVLNIEERNRELRLLTKEVVQGG